MRTLLRVGLSSFMALGAIALRPVVAPHGASIMAQDELIDDSDFAGGCKWYWYWKISGGDVICYAKGGDSCIVCVF